MGDNNIIDIDTIKYCEVCGKAGNRDEMTVTFVNQDESHKFSKAFYICPVCLRERRKMSIKLKRQCTRRE